MSSYVLALVFFAVGGALFFGLFGLPAKSGEERRPWTRGPVMEQIYPVLALFGTILANAVALLFCLALCATFVWLLGRVGFLGALVTGLMVLLISYNVELEDGSAIGSDYTPGLFAAQRRDGGSPEERAAREADRAQRRSVLNVVRHAGAALVTVGALGFFFFQI
jgi:hypothetical protein